jgi:DNA mismatch repair ATPase MutS
MNSLFSFYNTRKKQFESELSQLQTQSRVITAIRIISFAAAFILFYFLFFDALYAAIGFLIPIIIFAISVKKSGRLNEQIVQVQNLIDIQEKEIVALKYDFSSNENGSEYAEMDHHFSADFGILGRGSIFQLLNRTVTKGGARLLAGQLLHPELDVAIIQSRQKAVQELAKKTEWQHQFRAHKRSQENKESVEFPSVEVFPNAIYKGLYYLIPVIVIGIFVGYLFDFIDGNYLSYSLIVALLFTGTFLKKTTEVSTKAEDLLKDVSSYTDYIKRIENETFQEQLNQEAQARLKGDQPASESLNQLKSILNAFDNRNNMIMGIVLNAFLLWDVRCLLRFSKWQESHGEQLEGWLLAIYEIDARISLGNYVFNNPENKFPSLIQKDDFYYQAESLSHPMLKPDVRVPNSLLIDGWNQIDIVTGANMAGKSTFLRTVGVSMVMGTLGVNLPGTLNYTPVALFSSMKTEDSLNDNESYFFAELKRLKQLVDLLEKGQPTFAILDEILKGTNSRDKATGSAEFLKKLLRYPMSGIIATHDLSLCELNAIYPNNIQNYAFEVEMKGDDLHFDYTLKRGVCQNMNATFLLKKMNLID